MSRVLTIAPMPPEKLAYALARYSRSPDSIRDSIEWVRSHDSGKFLESFYFQYGHASIADLGHLAVCFEGISELAATEVEDEPLWDGQARSSRYQDFSRSGFVVPPELKGEDVNCYQEAGEALLRAYSVIHERMFDWYQDKLPRPEDMKPDAYKRNLTARAFDVARYCLFWGIPTGVGQVVSIRTLEKQVRRLRASTYQELRDLGDEIATACAQPAACGWSSRDTAEPVAPTLARFADPDLHPAQSKADLRQWAEQNLPQPSAESYSVPDVDLLKPIDTLTDAVACLLYEVTARSYRELYELAGSWSLEQREEVVDVALRSRTRRDEMLRSFRGGPYVYDIVMDIGAYRDLHRHRRCVQLRQDYGTHLGYAVPEPAVVAGCEAEFRDAMDAAFASSQSLRGRAAEYILPFATRSRFLFKMDFAEAEYICRLRSGVKGHFSYRKIAWDMKCAMENVEPALARLMSATPPWVEDPLKR
ncbi:MAG TPA: FAD-dependent thymidylate synthase [Bryobacteraceae bacterium]|nr:FAD-dependent thymidylate synthase [Bryobacteraceae bacterium]